MTQPPLAFDFSQQDFTRVTELIQLRDEGGEHDRQFAPGGGPDQRLELHAHDAGLVEPDADRTPAKRRVRFIQRVHVGQHLVRPDIQRAKHHALALCRVQNAAVGGHQIAPPARHTGYGEELQFGAEQAHPPIRAGPPL